jgi:hypothetical protein
MAPLQGAQADHLELSRRRWTARRPPRKERHVSYRQEAGRGVSARTAPTGRVLGVLCVVLAVAALMAVALLNGAPIVHYDTGRYLRSSFSFAVPVDRPVFYSLFIWISRGLAPSLWATVLLQAMLTALVIERFLSARSSAHGARLLLVTLPLTALSSVAWFSGFLTADLFTGLLFLAVVSLLLDGTLARRGQAVLLVAIIAGAVAVHTSHLLILPLFLLVAGALLWPRRHQYWRACAAACAAFALALAALGLVNAALDGRFRIATQAAPTFILARWIDHGAVQALLEQRCDDHPYALCAQRDQLRNVTSSWFLFDPASPLRAIGGLEHSAAAVRPMLRDTLRFEPSAIAWGTLRGFARQLLVFRTGVMHVAYDEAQSVNKAIRTYYADEYPRWQASLQQRGGLRTVGYAVSWLHVPVAVGSVALLAVVALPARLRRAPAVAPTSRFLARAVLAYLLGNAAVCAAFAPTNDRYQSRVIWLAVLVAIEVVIYERNARAVRRAALETCPAPD